MIVYRDMIKEGLAQLADRDYQERIWGGNGGRVQSSFVECLETIFDDSVLSIALERGEEVFSVDIDRMLIDLSTIVDRVPDTNYDEQRVNPNLLRARRISRAILDVIASSGY